MKAVLKQKCLWATIIFLFSTCGLLFSQNDIRTYNTSNYLGDGKWSWKVYVNASKTTLNQISTVTYTLHKTFSPNRIAVNRIGSSDCPFAFSATGWGVFDIKVDVKFRNGQTKTLTHPLKFISTPARNAISTYNTSREISRGWWAWTVYISSSPEVLNKIKCVEYTLDKSFPRPVQLMCSKGSDAMPFSYSSKGYGIFDIKVKVIYLDGTTQDLVHKLTFRRT
jgi:transcription initiation factor IIF auxiliary subunit